MGRVHPIAAAGFGSAAEVYERARPSYPQSAVDWIVDRCGLAPGRVVADIGAGTGKLTRLLVPSGARVIGVEPLPEMRAKLVETTPDAEALDGTAEAIPLADESVDALTVAQAFHWFDHDRALPEIHRVLREDGTLVLVWNMRDLDDPVQRGVEDLLGPMRNDVPGQILGAWREPLTRTALFGPATVGEFKYEQRFTTDDLCDRVASTSFVAALPPVDREELLVRVRALTHGIPEPFAFPYKTEVHVIPRSSDRDENERGTSIKG
jgi:SAM-dependent methyltransferase